MDAFFTYLLLVVSILLLAPTLVLVTEVLSAVAKPPLVELAGCNARPRVAVVVPAHNEAANITELLPSIALQLRPHDRLVVVADNCADETAELARHQGCEVVVRNDDMRRGKGYALDAGIRYLEAQPPEVVIIIDADTHITNGFVDKLAQRCALANRPAQAKYLMLASPLSPLKTRVAAFAWTVKNYLRPVGLHRLGLPCQLMGSGMAFPWRSICAANLSTGHLVEDLKLGIDLAVAGYPPLFCPDILVTSSFPASKEGQRTQRARWEHGHLGLILSDAPKLLWQALGARNFGLFALTLDLCVPPIALLAILMAAVWLVDASLAVAGLNPLPLALSTLSILLLVSAVLVSWIHDGRRTASFGALLHAVVYAVSKAPLYCRFVVARQTAWVRSRRDGDYSPGTFSVMPGRVTPPLHSRRARRNRGM